MPRGKTKELPTFYVEKPSSHLKRKHVSDGDKHGDTRKKAPKKQLGTSGEGQGHGAPYHPPEQRTPSQVQEEAGTEALAQQNGQRATQAANEQHRTEQLETHQRGDGERAHAQYRPNTQVQEQRSGGFEESQQAGGQRGKGKAGRPPLSEERRAQLDAARARANEVRKQRGDFKKQERKLKDALFEEKRRHYKLMEQELEAMKGADAVQDPDYVNGYIPKKTTPEITDADKAEAKALEPSVFDGDQLTETEPHGSAQVDASVPVRGYRDLEEDQGSLSSDDYSESSDDEDYKTMRIIEEYERKKRMEKEKRRAFKRKALRSVSPEVRPVSRARNDPVTKNEYARQMDKVRTDMLMQAVFGGSDA